eukprot:5299098-Pyramimonas_sp.AAC.1
MGRGAVTIPGANRCFPPRRQGRSSIQGRRPAPGRRQDNQLRGPLVSSISFNRATSPSSSPSTPHRTTTTPIGDTPRNPKGTAYIPIQEGNRPVGPRPCRWGWGSAERYSSNPCLCYPTLSCPP